MRRASLLLLFLTAVIAMPGTASADPKTEPLWLDCQGVPSGWVAANGNGSWTPGLQSGGTGVYVPYAFDFEFWVTPEGGDEYLVGSDSIAKQAPRNSRSHPHGVCTFQDIAEIDDPEVGVGVGRFVGTAWVFYTGS